MENKINIAELLKDCPRDMELDCTIYEDVYFDYVDELNIIHCYIKNKGFKTSITFNQYGTPNSNIKSKCVIFPKGKTTWEGFVPPIEFKDGDILYTRYGCDDVNGYIFIFESITENTHVNSYLHLVRDELRITKAWLTVCDDKYLRLATEEEKQKLFDAIKANGYKWNPETKTLEKLIEPEFKIGDKIHFWTIQDAKDGDVIFYDDGWTCIFKRIHGIWFNSYCFITSDGEFYMGYHEHSVNSGNAHLATKEQCNLFFQKIKEAGYKWNPETKTLEKLVTIFKIGDRIRHKDSGIYCTLGEYSEGISAYRTDIGLSLTYKDLEHWELFSAPDKFDINTLIPFESRVLVRDTDRESWLPAEFGFFDECEETGENYNTVGGRFWKQCIPYEGNEYLINTTNDCDEFYKTWKK